MPEFRSEVGWGIINSAFIICPQFEPEPEKLLKLKSYVSFKVDTKAAKIVIWLLLSLFIPLFLCPLGFGFIIVGQCFNDVKILRYS